MLAQHHVEYGKKAQSEIIGTAIILILVIAGIVVLWSVFQSVISTSPEESCTHVFDFSLEDACYNSNDEIMVTVKRKGDSVAIKNLQFNFAPSDSLWSITGKKCTDVRLNNREYGGYCDLTQSGETLSYIFNVADLEKQEAVSVYAGSEKSMCEIGETVIRAGC